MAFAALAAAGIAVADSNHSGLSDVQLANIEALSNGENYEAKKYKCYTSFKYETGSLVVNCLNCSFLQNYTDSFWNLHDYCYRKG